MRIGRLVLPPLLVVVMATYAWPREARLPVPALPEGPKVTAQDLTLAAALNLALEHNPDLAASAEEIRAREAAALQAGLPPNPDFAIEVENFAGKDELEGFDGAETTIALSQLVELGNKRGKRRQVAVLEKDLAGWDHRSKKLNVLAAATRAFIQVLAAQEQAAQSEELARLAEQTLGAVTARVESGKVPPVEQTRAQVELAVARTTAGKARRELVAARHRLAAFWGAKPVDFGEAVGDLTALAPLPTEEPIQGQMAQNPDLARWGTELEHREAALSLARAQAIPDLTLSFGVRNFRESESNALVAGFELPLPLFDRNQGNVGEARANLEKARRERRAAEAGVRADLFAAWQTLSAAHLEATTLRDEILPGAQSAFESADFGYREGKFDYLQVIDAQRTLFEVKGQYLQALAAFHQARTEVERLAGAPLHELPATATQNIDLR